MNKLDRVKPDTTIEEIVRNYPELIKYLAEFGIKCVACGEPIWGTLKENVEEKGLNSLDEILVKLNLILESK